MTSLFQLLTYLHKSTRASSSGSTLTSVDTSAEPTLKLVSVFVVVVDVVVFVVSS